MSRQTNLDEVVSRSLEKYFRDLEGTPPNAIYQMVIQAVERPMLEVVMREAMTSFLQAASERGCRYQIGTDMLFEQIPAYLEFFGLPTTTAEHLQALARLPQARDRAVETVA